MHWSRTLLALTFLTFKCGCLAALTCYKCDSVTLTDCATSLDSELLPIEECKSPYSCASSIVDSVTYRGCSSNTPRGPEYYKTCSESLCNKGVYPPGRLKCHQCSGRNCAPKPLTKPTPCVDFFEDDICYTDVIDEIDTYRGCGSDTIRNTSGMAEYCEHNGCNNLAAVETLTCSKCDSYDARGCKLDLFEINNASCVIANKSTCTDVFLLGHEHPECFLYTNLNHVVRGCAFDSGMLSLDVEHFETCNGNFCNKKCLKQQKCIVCNSQTNILCKRDPTSVIPTTCEGAETSSCHSCELKDGTIRRGCGVPGSTPDTHCYECQGEGCNTSKFTKCYKCTSDDSPNCGQWANPNIIDVENCEIAEANCISAVLQNGKTLRGCESSYLKCNDTQSSCYACSGNLCNNGVYPLMRLQCHHCDGREKCSNIVDNTNVLPCAKYVKDDACFEFLSGRNTMVRGCRSDNLYNECLLASQNSNGCRLCAGSGCNRMPVKRPASLICHKCSRSEEACSWLQGDDTLETCQQEVKFLAMESCFTRRFLDGSTSRGCSLDLNATDVSEEFLGEQKCTDEGCNARSQVAQKCFACRDSIKEGYNTCKTSILCGVGSLRFEERGCYIKIDGEFIQRNCASALTSDELQICKKTIDKKCNYCQGIECNESFNLTFVKSENSSFDIFGKSLRLNLVLIPLLVFYLNKYYNEL